jgi:hypothetical protein
MASCFCAFTRKRRAMEIMPQIQFTNQQIQVQILKTVQTAASIAGTKDYIKFTEKKDDISHIVGIDDDYNFEKTDDIDSAFLPFINM